jgi:muramoyltetrapeptide carboxypeptidase
MMNMKPQRLKKGDTVGVVAPASPPNLKKMEQAICFLKELGLEAKLGKHVTSSYGYLAGKDEERLQDLHDMFADKEVKAIICARGGFGTARLAEQLDYELIKNNPKIFWGYSDITFLYTAIHQRTGLVTFHGPMLSSDMGRGDTHERTKHSFQQLFSARPVVYTEEISPLEIINGGKAEGETAGGNLSILVSTLGTPFEVDTKGKILFIEEIGEEPYKVDRMLNQLKMAGKLADASGIVIGSFNHCEPKEQNRSLSLDEVIADYVKTASKPAMKGFKIGHCSPHITLPIGVKVTMDTQMKRLTAEPGVQ